jgi:hypothetical protein
MNHDEAMLWQKISAFPFDEDQAVFPFRVRLARENHWSLAYTARVCEEYKRFLFLGQVSGHPISPSDAVDQAWHLHLMYTRSYWVDLCQNIFGKPFHHSPTSGGEEESSKFEDWYAKTLRRYVDYFEESPPEDIWPELPVYDPHARVNLKRVWIVPKSTLFFWRKT